MTTLLDFDSVQALLAAIRKHEGGPTSKAYDQLYWGSYKKIPKGTKTSVSSMTLKEVLALQSLMVKNGSASSAAGAYQFIKKTLQATISALGISIQDQAKLIWTRELQDQMAMRLLKLRGIVNFCDGHITRETFANNLAAEWASLPMVTGIKKGKSKYAGDGLNKSHHAVNDILALVDAIKAEYIDRSKRKV